MRYVMKQKIWSLAEEFTIQDNNGNPVYKVKGKLLSIGDKLRFQTMDGEDVALIKQEIISLRPSYRILRQGELQAEVSKRLLPALKKKFKVDMKDGSQDLEIKGNILSHEYHFMRGDEEVAHISKKWVSLRDAYGIDIDEGEDDVLILACAVVVDMISHGSDDD